MDTPTCGAWGYWPSSDADKTWLRRHGVQIAGPCKRDADHEGDHSLDADALTPAEGGS